MPVGVFLSSGLDSSTLTALASEFGGQLRTVTLGFEEYKGTASDETSLAEEVARRYGTNHQTIWVTRKDFENDLDRLFHSMDQPSCDGVNSYFISKAAAQAGLKVVLSGLGGDELFGGYPSFNEIPRAVSALRIFPRWPVLGRAFRAVTSTFLPRMTSPKYAGVFEYGGSYGGAYMLRRGMFMPWGTAGNPRRRPGAGRLERTPNSGAARRYGQRNPYAASENFRAGNDLVYATPIVA